jgi:hypothetical protein
MTRSGWNPTRRNRNIGTAKSGRGLANRLSIPRPGPDSRAFFEKLRNPVRVDDGGYTLLIEPCLPGFVHSVTVDDTLRVLGLFPHDDVARIRTVALRQPTRKQRILSSVWGRLGYFATFSGAEGPAIVLEAQQPAGTLEWPRSLDTEAADEIERLREDGHDVTLGPRSWTIRTRLESVRATQLFRTLPHEIGHYVHFDREVRQRAAGSPKDLLRLQNAYFSKPHREREAFAHRYAREFVKKWTRERRIPFERLVDKPRMKRQGLQLAWFGLERRP